MLAGLGGWKSNDCGKEAKGGRSMGLTGERDRGTEKANYRSSAEGLGMKLRN